MRSALVKTRFIKSLLSCKLGFIKAFLVDGVAGIWDWMTGKVDAAWKGISDWFSGEAGKAVLRSGNKSLGTAFGALRMIVTVGWAIYPLGYIFGYLTGGVDSNSLNVIYNLADFINKIAFGVIIWA